MEMSNIYKEIWKDIEGYEGIYQISNYGKIKSFHKDEKILKPRKVKDGYLMICLHKNGKGRNYQVHRLVAKHFIDNFDEKLTINHKDYNKENNRIDNLEIMTHYDNVCDYFKKVSKTGYVGINKQHNKYRVRYKKKTIGYYKDLDEAISILKQCQSGNLITAGKEV